MFQANIVPGQGFKALEVYSKKGGLTSSGRPVTESYQPSGRSIYGILAEASPSEIDEWKQKQHPITHNIVQYGTENQAQATDYLRYENRWFYIQAVDNAGSLGISVLYRVEERNDLTYEWSGSTDHSSAQENL